MLCNSTSTDVTSYFWLPSAAVLPEINADDSYTFLSSCCGYEAVLPDWIPKRSTVCKINTPTAYLYPGYSTECILSILQATGLQKVNLS